MKVRLSFENPFTPYKCWYHFLPTQTHKISDLCSRIISEFGLTKECPNGVILEIDGFELLSRSETNCLLKEDCLITVRPDEKRGELSLRDRITKEDVISKLTVETSTRKKRKRRSSSPVSPPSILENKNVDFPKKKVKPNSGKEKNVKKQALGEDERKEKRVSKKKKHISENYTVESIKSSSNNDSDDSRNGDNIKRFSSEKLQHANSKIISTPTVYVPPGLGSGDTKSRNIRRRKRKAALRLAEQQRPKGMSDHDSELACSQEPGVGIENEDAIGLGDLTYRPDDSGTPELSLPFKSLKNRNKKKTFLKEMTDLQSSHIRFEAYENRPEQEYTEDSISILRQNGLEPPRAIITAVELDSSNGRLRNRAPWSRGGSAKQTITPKQRDYNDDAITDSNGIISSDFNIETLNVLHKMTTESLNSRTDEEYEALETFLGTPKIGDAIAYKILELSKTDWTPQFCFKEAIIVGVHPQDLITLKLDPKFVPAPQFDEQGGRIRGRFEIETGEDDEESLEDDTVTVNWKELVTIKKLK